MPSDPDLAALARAALEDRKQLRANLYASSQQVKDRALNREPLLAQGYLDAVADAARLTKLWDFEGRQNDDKARRLDAAEAERDTARAEVARLKDRVNALMAALADVLASASPNERDHPAMSAAWARARLALVGARIDEVG